MKFDFISTAGKVETNARIRWLPDSSGEYQPYELTAFERAVFVPPGWEKAGYKKPSFVPDDGDDVLEDHTAENRRKSYNRARNKLFDILMCTMAFDSFVTLTLSGDEVDRYDYAGVVKRLGVWLDNRVRRNGLCYAFVPELHKDGAVHFHGLVNMQALKTERARSAHSGRLLYDKAKRAIYNVTDFPLGFSTLIPLSGDNARVAAAKYCYKYITKSHGEKVGGRYYLSGGDLGEPRYTYLNVDFDSVDSEIINIGGGVARLKKKRF